MTKRKQYNNKKRYVAAPKIKTGKAPCSYHRNKVIFVDVDGTLRQDGALNIKLVDWCIAKKQDGFEIVLWSARGEKYAKDFAFENDVVNIFDKIISKPGYIVDDKGWSWIQYTAIFPLRHIADLLKT